MNDFPVYESHRPIRDVRIITPGRPGCFHRFFDTSPFSPSGRLACLLQVPFEDHVNEPGDRAAVVVVDLETGEEHEVAQTAGWEFQMGANLQWGEDDDTLLFTDVDTNTWEPHGVRLRWRTGERAPFPRGIYHASPDGRAAAVTNPATMRRTQKGYGVLIPDDMVPRLRGLSEETGLWITEVNSGRTDLVVPVRKLVLDGVPREEREDYESMENYPFHTKWNLQGDRLIVTLRRKAVDHPDAFGVSNHRTMLFDVFTCDPDGRDIQRAVPWPEWKKHGHHITFFPGGDRLSMNLRFDGAGTGMLLVEAGIDGSNYRPITRAVPGSGHPTVHSDGVHVLTDTYVNELPDIRPASVPDDHNPIRWINVDAGTEETLAWIPTRTPHQANDSVLRVDPHPAWSRDWSMVMVNSFLGGTRTPLVIRME